MLLRKTRHIPLVQANRKEAHEVVLSSCSRLARHQLQFHAHLQTLHCISKQIQLVQLEKAHNASKNDERLRNFFKVNAGGVWWYRLENRRAKSQVLTMVKQTVNDCCKDEKSKLMLVVMWIQRYMKISYNKADVGKSRDGRKNTSLA